MGQDSDKKNPYPSERRSLIDQEEYFNKQFDESPRHIEPGDYLCDPAAGTMLVATAGSGILVTLFERELTLGAMAHVFMPEQLMQAFPYFDQVDEKWKKEAVAPIEHCIAELKKRGAGRHRIQMRLLGGCQMPERQKEDAGTKNYIFFREYITRKGLALQNEDLGGPYIRRVHFFPKTGRTVRFLLRREADFIEMRRLESQLNNKK